MSDILIIETPESRETFICPRCGGTHFGRNLEEDVVTCHDEFHLGCRWKGPWSQRALELDHEKRNWLSELSDNYYRMVRKLAVLTANS